MKRSVAAVIVAAGRGERAGQSEEGPKQYRSLASRAVIAHTVRVFLDHPAIDRIVIVIHRDDRALLAAALETCLDRVHVTIAMGEDRDCPAATGSGYPLMEFSEHASLP